MEDAKQTAKQTASRIIQNITERGFETQQAAISMLDQLAVQGLSHQNIRRHNAQVDAYLKDCNPDYVPPREEEGEDGVGARYLIISGNAIIGGETTMEDLIDTANECQKDHVEENVKEDRPETVIPKPPPQPPEEPAAQTPPTNPWWKKVPWLGIITALGVGGVAYQVSRPQYVDVPARETSITAEMLSEIEGLLK